MKTLTAITNQSTVTAVQNIQALIAQLNEAVERDPRREHLEYLADEVFNNEHFEPNIDGNVAYFETISEHAQNQDTKSIALHLRDIFKLFQD